MANIVLIGAGSTAFSIELLKDISNLPSMNGSTLSLVDIDENRLAMSKELVSKYCEESKINLQVKIYSDYKYALPEAEYVICAVKVGGYQPLEKERLIAEEYGYYRGIGDRVSCYYGGIGAYHQITFLKKLANYMEKACPDAWLIQTANPVFEGTNYITRHTKIKAVGVCHGHNAYKEIIHELCLDINKVSIEIVGFNHNVWLTKFLYDGKDAYPLLDKWIEEESESYWKSDRPKIPGRAFYKDQLSPGAIDMYKLYGLMPIGDTCRSASPWWHHTDYQTKCKWYGEGGGFDSEVGWPSYLKSKLDIQSNFYEIIKSGDSVMEGFKPSDTTEQHIPFIDSLANNNERILTLNIPNRISIEGLPCDILVEIPVVCNSNGIHNINIGSLPKKLMNNIILPRLERAENIMDAYHRGDRNLLYLMLMSDQRTKSYKQAKELVDRLLSLPWNVEADRHYR